MARDFDAILEDIGSFGSYQKLMLIFVLLPASTLISFSTNSIWFQTIIPDHWCHVAGRDEKNFTKEAWKAFTIPRNSDGKFASCQRYQNPVGKDDFSVTTNFTIGCPHGPWEFDNSAMWDSVATSFGWLCERESYSTHIMSINLAGNAVGTFILPSIGDKYLGRRLTFYLAMGIYGVFTLMVTWTPIYWLHLAGRFLAGMAFQTNYQIPLIIVLELMCPEKRALAAFFSFTGWTSGMCLMAFVGWLLPHWQYIAILSCLPSVLAFVLWKFLPESPRWLLARGDVNQCTEVLLKVSKVNKVSKYDKSALESDLMPLSGEKEDTANIKEVFKYPKLRTYMFAMQLISASIFTVYGCLLMSLDIIPNNYFLNFFILSAMELPANFTGWLSTHYLGRRATSLTSFITASVIALVCAFYVQDKWNLLALTALLKFFATQGIYVTYVLATELYPTPIRSSAMGFSAVFGMLGMVSAPYIMHADMGSSFPYFVMSGILMLGALCLLHLPETLGVPLPQTFQEAEELGSNRPRWVWIHHWNHQRYADEAAEFKLKNCGTPDNKAKV